MLLDTRSDVCKTAGMTDTTDMTTDDKAHTGTPAPSAAYDGCLDVSSIDNRYRELHAAASKRKGGITKAITAELQEDHRRAHVRLVGGHGPRRSTTPRRPATAVVLQPTEAPDGALVITCAGPCGEEKSFRKFPTLSGGRPGREAVCRSCRDAALAERKKARR